MYKSKEQYKKILEEHVAQLSSQQELLYASNRYAVLLIFQAMDAAGKDGAIKHVMSGVNPQGCQVFSFKHPSAAELEHDFLWRTTRDLPERGRIGIFNRSYYEEVLIARVHPVILRSEVIPDTPHHDKKLWPDRYRSIVDLERHLHVNGTRIIASAQGRQGRPSTLYQHLPQVFAASFSDPNRRGLPPVVACRGTSASHAARLRPRAKVSASLTAATSAVALSAPTPGMLVSRRAASSRFASTANSTSNAAILSSSASHRVSMSSIRSWIRELSSPAPCRRSSVTRSLSLARPYSTMTPRSSRTARNWFIKDVRSRTA